MLRNHLTTTVTRKSVLVPVVGNMAASKLLDIILVSLARSVEKS